ncbi:YeiH family protein [Paractinoplanes toevensis]|uniref:AraC family transcriptional regulator n=1 Tax=Paractinoplanes toevensis TaxID=571911 RepID=A0A919TE75_9ACTN|nr:putative sulfate exporter family transporter [Actinoplanes toevensis]GIM93915.1 AraC family transcriptional regulator [Actinoplanes toevensis]
MIVLLLGLAAVLCGTLVPVLGVPVFAVVGGVLLSRVTTVRQPTLDLAKGPVLQASVVMLGAQLSLGEVASVGLGSVPVMLGTLAVCLGLAWLAGKALGVPGDLRTLIGVGTGICGASAIAAVTPAIRARSGDVAYAISTIFLFNVAAVVVFPPLGHLLGLSQEAFGLFAGTAVNDTSAVVAAATGYGPVAAEHAVVVKLVRTLMIVPVVLVLGGRSGGRQLSFLGAFVLMAGLHTIGFVPAIVLPALHWLAVGCVAVALAAVGLSTDVAALRRAGPRPLLLGFVLWVSVAATSLGLQQLT